MKKHILKMFIKIIFYLVIFIVLSFSIPMFFSRIVTHSLVFSVSNVESSKIAIVFGAGLQRDGTPSPVLKDRVSTAVQLYFAGKVEKLLMSGDNRFIDYNEPGAMKAYAIELGVPENDIVLDYAGRRTYDTCFRALNIFKVDEAILVTQKYHLPRALMTCSGLGLHSKGVIADLRTYDRHSYFFWNLREIPATLVAIWQVWVSHPLPVMGNPESISFIESNINHD